MTTRHTHLTRDIKPVLPGQSTSGCPACDLHHERERLFEVFKAGWEAGRSTTGRLAQDFNAWLQEQVDEVDVLGREAESSRGNDSPPRLTRDG